MMPDQLTIPKRFRGPPESGNGGYVAGVFAEQLQLSADQGIEITLRAPIPLDKTLTVHRHQ